MAKHQKGCFRAKGPKFTTIRVRVRREDCCPGDPLDGRELQFRMMFSLPLPKVRKVEDNVVEVMTTPLKDAVRQLMGLAKPRYGNGL